MNFKLRHTRGRLHSANYTFNNEVGSHRDMILSRLAAIGSFYLRLSSLGLSKRFEQSQAIRRCCCHPTTLSLGVRNKYSL